MKKIINIFGKYHNILIFALFILLAGFLSLELGMERNLDTRNYHIYNPYAFLTGRLSLDLMPASCQSYYNPLLDVPYYLAIKYFNDYPSIITFLYGFSYALYLFIIYKISGLIFKNSNKTVLTFISVFLAASSFSISRNVGGLNHDIFIGDLSLLSLYFILKYIDLNKYSSKLIVIAGGLLGISVGFKYTAIIFAIPIFITFCLFMNKLNEPLKALKWLFISAFLGFIIVDGFWMIKLYTIFQNPMFPYFNWVFHSPDIVQNSVFYDTVSHNYHHKFVEILFYPFIFKMDVRFIFIWLAFAINIFTIPFVNKEKFKEIFNIDILYIDFIFVFLFFAYVFWISIFSVPRYIAPIMGFAFILCFTLLLKILYIMEQIFIYLGEEYIWAKNLNFKYINKTFIVIFILLITPVFLYGYNIDRMKILRIPAENKLYFVQNMNIPDDSIVFTGPGVGAFVPSQNPKARYIKNTNIYSKKKIQEIKNYVEKNPAKIFLIYDENIEEFMKIDYSAELSGVEKRIKKMHKKYKNKNIASYTPKDFNYFSKLNKIKRRIERATHKKELLQKTEIFGVDINTAVCEPINNNIIKNNKPIFYLCKVEVIK